MKSHHLHMPWTVASYLPAAQGEWGGKVGSSPSLVPACSSWGWPQRTENSDFSHEGLVNKPSMHLPSTSATEPSTNQCPSFPTPRGRRCWWVNKNQTILLSGHLSFCKAVGSAATCQRVCHWALHTWEVGSFLPPGNLKEGDLKCLKYRLGSGTIWKQWAGRSQGADAPN